MDVGFDQLRGDGRPADLPLRRGISQDGKRIECNKNGGDFQQLNERVAGAICQFAGRSISVLRTSLPPPGPCMPPSLVLELKSRPHCPAEWPCMMRAQEAPATVRAQGQRTSRGDSCSPAVSGRPRGFRSASRRPPPARPTPSARHKGAGRRIFLAAEPEYQRFGAKLLPLAGAIRTILNVARHRPAVAIAGSCSNFSLELMNSGLPCGF